MKVLRSASEDEVIAEFLKAEIDSPRFSHMVVEAMESEGVTRSIIDEPDLNSGTENETRQRLLDRARGWKSHDELFPDFPQDICWWLAELDREDIFRVQYINYEDWLEVSGGTRLGNEAASRIASRASRYAHLWDTIPASEIAARTDLPRLILVGTVDGSKLVLLEGHVRHTAFFVADNIPTRLEVFLGTSDRLHEWGLW